MPLDIGEHCSKPGCNQKDFLPFECDACAGVFCLEHRTYVDHTCPNAGSRDSRAITCPLCRGTISLTQDQDVNIVFDQHTRSNCNPEQYNEKKKAKSRCEAENCREILTASNTVQCPICRKKVCLRHRFETDHQCKRQKHIPPSRSTPSSTSTPAFVQQKLTEMGNTVSSSVSRLVDTTKKSAPKNANAVTASTESCPICAEKFRYTAQLIAHVRNAHPETPGSRVSQPPRTTPAPAPAPTTSTIGNEVCPICRASFHDVAVLIDHVERNHPNETNGKKSDCLMM